MNPLIMKAEILITRRCNLRCDYCRMPTSRPEIPPDKWIEIFESLTKRFGCPFYPIYGAEPLLYEGLEEIIKWFAGREDCAYSILTNAVALTEEKKQSLLDAGLKSITLSVDSLAEISCKSIHQRNDKALAAIDWALSAGIEDVQATATVHRQNMQNIAPLVNLLSEKGVWFSFDFIHDDKNLPYYSKVASRNPMYAFDPIDVVSLEHFLTQMRALKTSGMMIYQSFGWFDYLLEDPFRIIDRTWRCSADPAWVTIDSDGMVLICDDYQAPSWIYGWELADRWEDFKSFKENIHRSCRRCAWSTHWMAEQQLKDSQGVQQISHGRLGCAG